MSVKDNIGAFLWVICLGFVWELVARLEIVSSYILPSLSSVVQTAYYELINGSLGIKIQNSFSVIMVGYLLSIAMSFLVIWLCYYSKSIKLLFSVLCTILNPLPSMAILPLVIMWFGIKTRAITMLIIHGVAWTLLRYLLDGMDNIPRVYIEWGENIEMSSTQKFIHIACGALLPDFISGLKVAWGRAWRALIGAEMIFGMVGDLGGIGFYISQARAYGNIKELFAGILVIIMISLFVEIIIFGGVEKITIQKWEI